MNTSVELKDEITFDEFKAWMNGLVRGKGSQLPNIDDWRMIKKMMDKVVPDVEKIIQHTPIYAPPVTPSYEKYPQTPMSPWCEPQFTPTYGSGTGYGFNTTDISCGSTAYGAPLTTKQLSITNSSLKVSQTPGKVK